LYAISIVPRLIGCSPTSFFFLQDKLIDNDFDNSQMDDEVAFHMKTLQTCFDIRCSDLSADTISDTRLSELVSSLCIQDSSDPPSIVGYQPSSDVTEVSRSASANKRHE
jgi:hypothetical protein